MSAKKITIGNRKVGSGEPAFVVAEIGMNHNGDMDLARKTILAARDAGADSVKFQNYETSDFVFGDTLTYSYRSQGAQVTESQRAMFERYELSAAQLEGIAAFCAESGTILHSTPTSAKGIEQLVRLGVSVLKNGSDYLTDLDLIKQMGETGLPVVISTGMATLEEIDDAVDTFRQTGNENLILLHCVSNYPAAVEHLHLRRMCAMRDRYECLVGFSDHSVGAAASALASGLGACWIEKHFTWSRDLPGPDHSFSSTPDEFSELVSAVRRSESALGSADLNGDDAQQESRSAFRLSCAARSALESGRVVRRDDIAFYRPGSGFPPKAASTLVGRRLKVDKAGGALFSEADFE